MSLLHEALKKASKDSPAGAGTRIQIDREEATSHGGANWRVYLLLAVAVSGLLYLLSTRYLKRSPAGGAKETAGMESPLGIAAGPPSAELLERAQGHIREKKWVGASGELEKVVILEPRNAEAYNNLGMVLRHLGEGRRALEEFAKALSIDPQCAECLNNLGVLHLSLRQLAEAKEQFRKAAEVRPDYADPHFHLALLAEAEGRGAEAKKEYEKFSELARGVDAAFLLKVQKRMASL